MSFPNIRFSDLSSVVYKVRIFCYLSLTQKYCMHFVTADKILLFCLLETAEYEARDTHLLPKLSGRSYDAMLGCRPKEKTRDERGGNHVRSNRHIKGQGDDTFVRTRTTGLFLLLPAVRASNLHSAISGLEIKLGIILALEV